MFICRWGVRVASCAVHLDQVLLSLRVSDLYTSDPATACPLAQMPPLETLGCSKYLDPGT